MAKAYLYGHGWEVPHVDDYGPAGHGAQQVADHVVLAAVPEGVAEARVVLRDTGEGRSVSGPKGQGGSSWSAGTLMATGWMVPAISKLPFLNIMTEVLLMQVPVRDTDVTQPSNHILLFLTWCRH